MFTNVTTAMKNVAKEASVLLLVANLENISTCSSLLGGDMKAWLCKPFIVLGHFWKDWGIYSSFERNSFPAMLSNPNMLSVAFQSVIHGII